MMARRILQSPVEFLEPWELTAARLQEFTKQELSKYVHDIIGGSWDSVRQRSKPDLIDKIRAYAARHPESFV